MDEKPPCRGAGVVDTDLGRLIWVLTGIVSLIGFLAEAYPWFSGPAAGKLTTIFGTAYPAAVILGAVAGAAVALGWVIVAAYNRLNSIPGIKTCYGGVVVNIVEAFSSPLEDVFPFVGQHDRTDVVVKPDYWPLVVLPPSDYVYCGSDSMQSPLLHSYYYTDEVEGAAIGSIIGAVVGAGVGIFAGMAVGLAIGCAATLFVACLVALIVAALVAAAAVLMGAGLGGNIGRMIAGGSSPTGTPVDGSGARDIALGDYVSVHVNLVVFGPDNNAMAAWWVESTDVHGRSTHGEGTGGGAPFNYADARDNLADDTCDPLTGTSGPVIL